MPGRENLRVLWSNFYRNIDFSGIMYVIDYDNKDTLDECTNTIYLIPSHRGYA